jgi:hypothetical protein
MRRFILFSLMPLTVAAALYLSPTSLAQEPGLPRGKRPAAPVSDEPAHKPRYPALAYAVAGLITLIIVAVVGFPSRKETWDQRAERRPRREGKRMRGE